MRHKQRAAINQAEVAKRCRLYGPLMEGARAFREGQPRKANLREKADERKAWFEGWDWAQEKSK